MPNISFTKIFTYMVGGGKYFTSLDMSQAYQQLLLHNDSKKLVTIKTHKGIFVYNWLPFGVSSAHGIFQYTLENLLQGIPDVIIYLDNIIVVGKTPESIVTLVRYSLDCQKLDYN